MASSACWAFEGESLSVVYVIRQRGQFGEDENLEHLKVQLRKGCWEFIYSGIAWRKKNLVMQVLFLRLFMKT
jgi:hypothetical protein